MNFPGRDAVLGINNHPHRGKPLIQTDWRILEDGASLKRELWGGVLLSAVPAVILFEEQDVLALAARADHAIRPATGHKVFAAVDRI